MHTTRRVRICLHVGVVVAGMHILCARATAMLLVRNLEGFCRLYMLNTSLVAVRHCLHSYANGAYSYACSC